jgi:hypothetical protein
MKALQIALSEIERDEEEGVPKIGGQSFRRQLRYSLQEFFKARVQSRARFSENNPRPARPERSIADGPTEQSRFPDRQPPELLHCYIPHFAAPDTRQERT